MRTKVQENKKIPSSESITENVEMPDDLPLDQNTDKEEDEADKKRKKSEEIAKKNIAFYSSIL